MATFDVHLFSARVRITTGGHVFTGVCLFWGRGRSTPARTRLPPLPPRARTGHPCPTPMCPWSAPTRLGPGQDPPCPIPSTVRTGYPLPHPITACPPPCQDQDRVPSHPDSPPSQDQTRVPPSPPHWQEMLWTGYGAGGLSCSCSIFTGWDNVLVVQGLWITCKE